MKALWPPKKKTSTSAHVGRSPPTYIRLWISPLYWHDLATDKATDKPQLPQHLTSMNPSIELLNTGWGLSVSDLTGYGFSPGPHLFLLLTFMQMQPYWLFLFAELLWESRIDSYSNCVRFHQDTWQNSSVYYLFTCRLGVEIPTM